MKDSTINSAKTHELLAKPGHEEQQAPASSSSSPPRLAKFFLGTAAVLLVTYMAATAWTSTYSRTYNISLHHSDNSSPTMIFKKHIKPIKPIHHGRVDYTVADTPEGRVYTREFTAKCGYGILTFNVGPAQTYQPFQFDVFHDEYAYSNNDGLCALLPTYKGRESRNGLAYWMPEDPTEVIIPFNKLTKISSRITKVHDSKPLDEAASKRCGDYVIIGKGNFYSADFYQRLKSQINKWRAQTEEEDVVAVIEKMLADM